MILTDYASDYFMPCLLCYHMFVTYKIAGPHPEKVWPAITEDRYGKTMPAHIAMITIFVRDCNRFAQSYYNSIINSIQFHQLTCSCGHAACLRVHGYYVRGIKLPDGLKRLRILRLRCCVCGTTHAVLLSSMVPYSRISTEDQRQICIGYEQGVSPSVSCDRNPSIDENNVKSIRRNYRVRWREMLRSIAVSLYPSHELIFSCFSNYSSQFMQIRRGTNHLFPLTT